MTESAIVCTDESDSGAAGRSLGEQICAKMGGRPPDALILFVSPKYDAPAFLRAVERACPAGVMVGCSSAGEFTTTHYGQGSACAVGLRSPDMRFAAGIGRGVGGDRAAVAAQVTASFNGVGRFTGGYSSALVLTDALAGHAEELIEQLTLLTKGAYQFFGGGAGDDANFRRTQVFLGTEVASDAVVALEILSTKPVGVGVRHGWTPAGAPLRVTEASGARIVSLNAAPAVEAFADHAGRTGQAFDRSDPVPFFLHNILGIDTGDGFKLRVPLAIDAGGAVTCAAEIPAGSVVRIMATDSQSAANAAAGAARDAVARLNGERPAVAIFFDCVATRLRMGKEFGFELRSVQDVLGEASFAGCNTYGQVARAEGQFSGFHNCTAVVCALPG
ncbi:MAG TPA: FIST N-terminal domain-containing protein [Tepidisphaeraceae bacterium]|nr:FIST N-terminal domain-containing protein [Tepidisphaeraceae bacterium]